MKRFRRSPSAKVLFVALVSIALVPALALALPVSVVTLDPVGPDGNPPWYVTAPEVFVTSDQTGVLHWQWDAGVETTMAVTTSTPVSVGFAPQGIHDFNYYTESDEGPETWQSQTIAVDSSDPLGVPTVTAAATASPGLSWTPVSDGGSGVGGYHVYRNTDGVAYSAGDRIAFVSSGTSYDGAPLSDGSFMWYSVSGADAAGNEGFLASPVRYGRAARISGADRYLTSIAVSQATFADDSVPVVVIASGKSYPDALCAAGLAGVLSSPVLLVGDGPISAALQTELARLGASDAFVVGGGSAVSDMTFISLQATLSGIVTRVSGTSRYETAEAVEEKMREVRGGSASRAVIVSGERFADALSASAVAYVDSSPILYARSDSLPAPSRRALLASGASQTVIVGGESVVWDGVEAIVSSPVRIAGSSRYDTSRQLVEWAENAFIFSGNQLQVVTGKNFPDGLSAAPFAGEITSPLVLTSSTDAPALAAWLSADPLRYDRLILVGGTSALSSTVATKLSEGLVVR